MITFFATLLKKAIIQIATTNSVYAADTIAAQQYRRSAYVLKVLEASAAQRAAIKAECLASDSDGQIQLAAVLHMYDALPAEKQAEYRIALKAASSLFGGGEPYIAIQTAYQGGQQPPIQPP